MSLCFWTAAKTTDQQEKMCCCFIGHKVKQETLESSFVSFERGFIGYNRTPLYGFRSNQNLYFLIKLLFSGIHPAKR